MKLKKRIEQLARNYQTKLEVKNFTDQYLEENADVIKRQQELQRMKYLQVVIGKTQTIKNKMQSQEEQKHMNREIYARKMVLSDLKS